MKFYRPRQRHIPGQMNKLEEKYSSHLDLLKKAGEVEEYGFAPMKLKLADNTFYTPDFLVVTRDEIQFHEVKGFWEDDARVKIKVAANKFWWAKFKAIQLDKETRQWVVEEF